jgi:protein O-mannosyl-transferase
MSKQHQKNKNQKSTSQPPDSYKGAISHRSSFRWAYIFLFVFAILLYANTLNHSFAFDDSVVITGNKYTRQGLDGVKTLATKDLFYGIYGSALDLEGGRWRPLTLVMFAVEYQFFGNNATPYHFINILLYGITAIVLFMTLLQIFLPERKWKLAVSPPLEGVGGGLLAFITTLLFIAHPIHTEVVANIKSRDEIVSFLFLCLMLFFLFRFTRSSSPGGGRRKGALLFISVLCYFTALLSKENGITFIAIIPLALLFFANKNIKQSSILTIPFIIVAVFYFLIRTHYVGVIGDRQSNDITDNPFLALHFPNLPTPIPFMDKLATISWILLKYLLLLIFPNPLTSDYGFNQIPIISFSNPRAIASIVIYGGLIFYAIKIFLQSVKTQIKGSESILITSPKLIFSFSILYFVITISIVSNLFFLIGTTMGERFAYISSLGFCLTLASIFLRVTSSINLRLDTILSSPSGRTKVGLLLLILIPYSYKTITRNPDWKDNKALFTADVKTSSNSANAHYYYANTIFTDHINDEQSSKRDSLFIEAKKEFRQAMTINPYFHYCYYNIGLIWEKLGQPDSAIVYQQKTINLKPDNSMAQYMAKGALGLVYGKLKGDFEHAIPLLKEALLNKPDDEGYHENLGICYAMKGDYDNSIREFETSLKFKTELKKEDARIFMNLALSWENKGHKQKADEYFQKAFQLNPSLKK